MATYLSQTPFRNGLALVQNKKKKFGFINEQNQEVIPCQYQEATQFSGALARVSQNDLWGMIDRTGKIVVPIEYENAAHAMHGNVLVFKDNLAGLLSQAGKVIVPLEYEEIEELEGGKTFMAQIYDYYSQQYQTALYNVRGKCLVKKGAYESMVLTEQQTFITTKDGKMGMIDSTGKAIIPSKFDSITETGFGNFVVYKNREYGVVDVAGKEVLPRKYHYIEPATFQYQVSAPYFIVQKDSKYGYTQSGLFDSEGEEILPCVYDFIVVKSPDLILTATPEIHQIVDSKGKRISPENYVTGLSFLPEGHYGYIEIIDNSRLMGIMNEKFEVVCKPIFSDIHDYEFVGTTLVVGVLSNDGTLLYGLYDFKKKKQILSCTYTSISVPYQENPKYFLLQQNTLYGLADGAGKILIPVEYISLELLESGNIVVKNQNLKAGIVNIKHKTIFPFEYDELLVSDEEGKFIGRQKHFFDKTGKRIENVPFLYYQDDFNFCEGLAKIYSPTSGKYGFINDTFELVFPFELYGAEDFSGGYTTNTKNNLYGIINQQGKWVIPAEYFYIDTSEGFKSGYFTAYKDNYLYGLVNMQNEVVLPFESYEPIYAKDGWAKIGNVLHNLATGKRVELPEGHNPYLPKEKVFLVDATSVGEGYYFINEKGKKLFDTTHLPHHNAEPFENGVAFMIENKAETETLTYRLVNKKGEILATVEDVTYFVRLMKGIYAYTNTSGTYQVIDTKGQAVVEGEYDYVMRLNDRKLFLQRIENEKKDYYIFDVITKTFKKLNYDAIYPNEQASYIIVGKYLAKYKDEERYGIVDSTGTRIIPCEHEFLHTLPTSQCAIAYKNGKYGAINFKNEVIVPFEYENYYLGSDHFMAFYEEKEVVI